MKNKKSMDYAQLYLTIMTVFALSTSWVTGCGEKPDDGVVIFDPPSEPLQSCAGSPLGTTRDQVCEAGYTGSKLYVCSSEGWVEKSDSCQKIIDDCEDAAKNKVSFEEFIKPLIEEHCMNCHAQNQLNTYPVAKSWANDSIRRMNLNNGNLEFMPKNAAPLSSSERALWDKWRADGLIDKSECAAGTDPYGNQFQTLGTRYVESEMLKDIFTVDASDRKDIRWALLHHKYNLKTTAEEMDFFVDGINKGLNSISQERDLVEVLQVDARRSIYRIDLDAFGLTAADWDDITKQEFFNFESETSIGEQLQALTGARLPWLHADNLVFTAHGGNVCNRNSVSTTTRCDPNLAGAFLYYKLLDFPIGNARVDRRFSDLVNLQIAYLGFNFQEEIDNFDAVFMGFFGSSISINKNRLLVRVESEEGRFWQSFDTNGNDRAEQNLFEFPLLAETNGRAIYDFQASESIFSLPNGFDAYFLSDANGIAADFAPLDTVFDNQTPGFDPTIRAPFSCYRCHQGGILPAKDQVLDSIGVGSDLGADDIDLVEAHYKPVGNQLFIDDNRELRAALDFIKNDVSQPDSINYISDRLRKDMSLAEVAAHTGLTPSAFLKELNGSVVRNQMSQLATGGKVSFQQLVNSYPDILKEFGIAEDPINEQ